MNGGAIFPVTAALMVRCGHCWAEPGQMCCAEGLHLARFARAYRKGLLAPEVMSAVLGAFEVIAEETIVRPGLAA